MMDSPTIWITVVGTVAVVAGTLWYWKTCRIVQKPVAAPPSYRTLALDCSRAALEAEMNVTRNRPVENLPIAVDLPRLARKTIIMEGPQVLLDGLEFRHEGPPDENSQRPYLIQAVWRTLSQLMGEESDIYTHLADHLQEGGDVSSQLGLWLRQHFSTDHSKVVRILKVCNQSILASSVIRMKYVIGEEWPYKDQRGQWKIIVRKDGDLISVTHQREEVSRENPEEEELRHFTFAWSLRMEFDAQVERMTRVIVSVDDINFLSSVPSATREAVVRAFHACEFIEPFQLQA